MESKELIKQQKIEEKQKLKAMTKEEKKAYLENQKIERNKLAEELYNKWKEEHLLKVQTKEKELEEKNKSKFWFNLGQSKFCQWFVRGWNKFKCKSPNLAKLVYQVVFFFIFSNGVTIWQYLVMLFLPNLFGQKLASIKFIWPQIELYI